MTRRRAIVGVGIGLLVIVGVVLYTQLTALSYGELKAALRAHGAMIQDDGIGLQPFLSGTDHRLRVNGEGVDVFEYRSALEAAYDASRISADGSTFHGGFGPFGGQAVVVDYVAPPHWFRAGRVIVLYVGRQSAVLAQLRQVLGPQFAGGDATVAMQRRFASGRLAE
jgi:hypothetical protein